MAILLPEPIRSSGWMLQPITTRAFISDEAGAIAQTDIAKVQLYVYENQTNDPLLVIDGIPVSDVFFDVLVPWGLDDIGHNFAHTLRYGETYNGQEFKPIGGTTLRLEYILLRQVEENLDPIPVVHLRALASMRTRALA